MKRNFDAIEQIKAYYSEERGLDDQGFSIDDSDLVSRTRSDNFVRKLSSVEASITRKNLSYFDSLMNLVLVTDQLGYSEEPKLPKLTEDQRYEAMEVLFEEELIYMSRLATHAQSTKDISKCFSNSKDARTWLKETLAELKKIHAEQNGRETSRNNQQPSEAVGSIFTKATKWEDVVFEILSNDHLKVKIGDASKRLHFAEIGFLDERKGDLPIAIWHLLIDVLGKNSGRIDWQTDVERPEKERNKIKKCVSDLRAVLKKLSGLNEDPFYPYRSKKAWVSKFRIIDKRDYGHEAAEEDQDLSSTEWMKLLSDEERAKYRQDMLR